MARPPLNILLVPLCWWAVVCPLAGCFTGHINQRPTVSIVGPTTDIARGDQVTFRAVVTDDQSGPLKYQWYVAMVACNAGDPVPTAAQALAPTTDTRAPTYSSMFAMSGDYCVWVVVTDDSNATETATHGFHVGDHPPRAVITVVTPGVDPTSVPLYTELHLTAAQSSDPDNGDQIVHTGWAPMQPACSTLPYQGCGAGAPADDICFTADKAGDCTFTLTVTDGEGMTGQTQVTFHVNADRPPCITETDPPSDVHLAWNPDDMLPVKVTRLDDDGDPLPPPADRPSMASFVWSWRVVEDGGAFSRLVDPKQQAYSFPGGYFRVGDTVQIRVEAHDRVDRSGELDSCTSAQPEVCDPTGMCKRWVTWTVEMVL